MPTVHDLVALLWNVARYGLWTSCRHHVLDRFDVRSARGPGVRQVPPEQWTICRHCKAVVHRRRQ